MLHSLNNHLTDTFGCSHDIGRIYGFIRRNQYHALRSVSSCCHSHIISTEYIVFNCLIRTVLHEWHMLMCSCMKNNRRFIIRKYGIHTMGISHRSNQHNQIQIREFLFQFLLKIIRGIFINIKYHQLRRMMRRDLAAEFTSDGTTATGYKYSLSRNVSHNLIQICFHWFPSQ